jgi:hypothetical protein
MNPDDPPMMGQRERLLFGSLVWLWVGPLVLVLLVLLYFALSGSSPRSSNGARGPTRSSEGGLDSVRQGLARQTDLPACRNALQQLNSELGDKTALRPPSLTTEERDWLRDHIGLSKEELVEAETSHFTRLDNHHLFQCFLLGEAANALEIKGVRGKSGRVVREQPLDRAERAFAWTMRQVRLRQVEGEIAPPSFVVRRGTGTALERALVFLALLEQLGDLDKAQPELLGFLLQVPDASGKSQLWTCGVVSGDAKNVYLFDPYLGLPLPGPNGEGIATLAQVCQKSDVLAQLNFDDKHRYPVTAEQVQKAQAQLVYPLSSLSPRLRFLQEKLLAPAVRVRLAHDAAADWQRVEAACAAGREKPIAVSASRDLCTLLRRFLSADEGGVNTAFLEQQFLLALVPWKALPAAFLDERRFPPRIGLGQRVREQFASPFIRTTMDAGLARDQLLRGRYSSAVPALVDERSRWRNQRQQAVNAANLEEKASEWLKNATAAYAQQINAKTPQERALADRQIRAIWDEKQARPIYIIINAAAAAAREPETVYQLNLCGQEQAEQLQARLDLQKKIGVAEDKRDRETAETAWRKALSDWKRFEDDYPDHPDLLAARRLRGRAASLLGDRAAALAAWKNIPASADAREALASLYLAKREEKKHPQKSQ